MENLAVPFHRCECTLTNHDNCHPAHGCFSTNFVRQYRMKQNMTLSFMWLCRECAGAMKYHCLRNQLDFEMVESVSAYQERMYGVPSIMDIPSGQRKKNYGPVRIAVGDSKLKAKSVTLTVAGKDCTFQLIDGNLHIDIKDVQR